MTDDLNNDEPGISAKIADSLTDATRAAGQVKSSFENAEVPKTIMGFASDATRAAPLTMLALAFVAGAIFTRRRRY